MTFKNTEQRFFNTEEIRSLDPLKADQLLQHLPEVNNNKDISALINLLINLTDSYSLRDLDTIEQSHAALRDIGIVLGSIKRHGVEPVQAVPEIEPLLIQFARRHHMVPRDTVLHYTIWNPNGSRRRTYTQDIQEQELQDAVTNVFPHLSSSLTLSHELSQMDARDVRFAPMVLSLKNTSEVMVQTIDRVIQEVSPIFFAQELRPYFEEITIKGQPYLGPAAAQVPLWLLDIVFWASDRSNSTYNTFLEESLKYALPSWREFYQKHVSSPSIVSRIQIQLEDTVQQSDLNLQKSASAVIDLLKSLKTFRGRHIGIAQKAYAEEVRLYSKGSGGAPVELLKMITHLTRDSEFSLRPSYHSKSPA